ncbi:MAG: glycosyltransferase family 4 protein [Deltaproteobacteria bacterium]|nr:MAG: glycosyltransferase family 4 protein [Deltaproteobacteria bacterium]
MPEPRVVAPDDARGERGARRAEASAGDIRVCIAVNGYPPRFAGHGIQIQRNLPALRARGIVPTILTERVDGEPEPPRADGAAVRRDLSPGFGWRGTLARILQFRRHFRAHRDDYDLVHAAMVGWEFLLNLPYLRKLGLPVVYEMVSLGADDPVALSQMRLGDFKLRRVQRNVDFWIGLTGVFRARVAAAGIPEDRFRVVYGGVDVDRFRAARGERRRELRARLGLPPEARIAISAGALVPRKGMDRVVKAWARTHPEPERDLLLIIGPARAEDVDATWNPQHADEVERLSRAKGVDGTVRIVGRVDNLDDYMSAADLFLFLSHREGLGYVTLEAMACELACVVSPLDGIAEELISEGRTGFIAREPDDPGSVAAIVSRLLEDASLRRRIGAQARRAVVERFTHGVRADALKAVYRDVLNRR